MLTMNTDVSRFDSTIPGGWRRQNRGMQKEQPLLRFLAFVQSSELSQSPALAMSYKPS